MMSKRETGREGEGGREEEREREREKSRERERKKLCLIRNLLFRRGFAVLLAMPRTQVLKYSTGPNRATYEGTVYHLHTSPVLVGI
jgi:hypothetical protein